MRRCPRRSTSQETPGPSAAAATAIVAETAPASPYDPVSWESIVTMPMPAMEIGSRAMNPAEEKARVPGAANIRR